MEGQLAPDQEIAVIAAAQGGVMSREQLRGIGLSPRAIDARLRSGRLHIVHRGVYAVGHPVLTERGRWTAAVLACGPGAVLSHASAAAAWDLRQTPGGRVDVTVPTRAGRARRAGIRVHRPLALPRDEVTSHAGIPVTTPARTLLDLAAGGLRGRRLEAVLDRAELLRLLDFADLQRLLERRPERRGASALSATLSGYVAGTVQTRSHLEEIVLRLCDAHAIARPKVNDTVAGMEVDFLWPRSRLVVEADGYAWHRSPSALSADRERDARLILAGYRVLRFTWAQVTRRPAYVAQTLHRALGAT